MNQLRTQADTCKSEQLPEINLAGIIRQMSASSCRTISSCMATAMPWSPSHAPAICLEAYIVAGSLVPSALDQLREVADNLGTTNAAALMSSIPVSVLALRCLLSLRRFTTRREAQVAA